MSLQVDLFILAFFSKYVGQGSAEVGMGMDLYKQSPMAKEIWDRAEKHMLENYGFSLMTIVNKNPKELIVGFGGPRGIYR